MVLFTLFASEKQVISLGAGFDTSFFVFSALPRLGMESASLLENVCYFEVDFSGVVARKSRII